MTAYQSHITENNNLNILIKIHYSIKENHGSM